MEILSKLLRTFINTHLSDSESVKLKEKIFFPSKRLPAVSLETFSVLEISL